MLATLACRLQHKPSPRLLFEWVELEPCVCSLLYDRQSGCVSQYIPLPRPLVGEMLRCSSIGRGWLAWAAGWCPCMPAGLTCCKDRAQSQHVYVCACVYIYLWLYTYPLYRFTMAQASSQAKENKAKTSLARALLRVALKTNLLMCIKSLSWVGCPVPLFFYMFSYCFWHSGENRIKHPESCNGKSRGQGNISERERREKRTSGMKPSATSF